jgi:hypothetical protein
VVFAVEKVSGKRLVFMLNLSALTGLPRGFLRAGEAETMSVIINRSGV